MAHHISVFMENKPGKLERISGVLQEQGINIRAISMASAGDFGVIKLLVNRPQEALAALQGAKITASLREISIVLIRDEPGALNNLLRVLAADRINIEDTYGFLMQNREEAAIVLETGASPQTATVLEQNGYTMLEDHEIYEL